MSRRTNVVAVGAVAAVMAVAAPETATAAPVPIAETANRDNFMHMSGEALRRFAHRMGIARSEAESLDDDRLKVQCRYAIARQQDDEA